MEGQFMSFIVVKITDGLGNQMFQYAYARTLQTSVYQNVYLDISDINNFRNEYALKTGWVDLCDKRDYQLDNFRITLPVIDVNVLQTLKKKGRSKNRFLRYCEELRLLPTVYLSESECRESGIRYTRFQNYYIEGNFFDKSYYVSKDNILRQEFRLKEKLNVPDRINCILKNRNTVSIHIRRGDFLKVGRNISEGDYYLRAMDYIKNKIKSPFLFVFSDDVEWVKQNMKFDLEHFFVSGLGFSDCEELMLMSMCKNNIIANSTFSYWGAWLNCNKHKIVIVPRGWRQKIIPNSWVLI